MILSDSLGDIKPYPGLSILGRVYDVQYVIYKD